MIFVGEGRGDGWREDCWNSLARKWMSFDGVEEMRAKTGMKRIGIFFWLPKEFFKKKRPFPISLHM